MQIYVIITRRVIQRYPLSTNNTPFLFITYNLITQEPIFLVSLKCTMQMAYCKKSNDKVTE